MEEKKEFSSKEEKRAYYISKLKEIAKDNSNPIEDWRKEDIDEEDE